MNETSSIDTIIKHVKQLEDKLSKFKIENAYLIELGILHFKEDTLLKNSENHPQS